MVHEVKCCPEYFEALKSGVKTFEVRKKDRPYQIGDFLALNELVTFDYKFGSDDECEKFCRTSNEGRYSGECVLFEITYILDDQQFCKDGMVILGIVKCDIRKQF